MRRQLLILSLLSGLLSFGIARSATAIELTSLTPTELTQFDIDGPDGFLTIEFNLTNLSEETFNGLGVSAYGYEGSFNFIEGSAVGSYLNAVCLAPASCFGGFFNLAGGALSESAIGANGNRVQVALSAGLEGVSNSGLGVDQGIDNQVGSAMFSLTFAFFGEGEIRVGTGYQGDGLVRPNGDLQQLDNELVYTVRIVPEPSSALLIGLGLAGLSAAGHRSWE